MYGSSKSSYQKIGGSKVIIRHSTAVNEEKRGSRTRNIRQVFVETADGERFKIPHQNLHAAKSIAYHLNNEGYFGDIVSERILEIAEKMNELKEYHALEEDADKRFWTRAQFLTLRENLKKAYGSRKAYQEFVTKVSPKPLKEAVEFEHWAVSIVPSDHLNEEYEENIVSKYLQKVNHASKATLPSIISEMVQLGIADQVVNHLTWPVKTLVTEALDDQNKINIDRAWSMKIIEVKRHKISVHDAIEDICKEFTTSKSYQEVKDYLTDLADKADLIPKDPNDIVIDKVLSKNKQLRDDLNTIKAQEYNTWVEIMRVVGQGLGPDAAMDQTIYEISAKYKITVDEATQMIEDALDRMSSKG